jgi:hypothetical protein
MGDDVLHAAPASANDRVSKPNGGSFSGASGAGAAGFNPRSCVTCRRRKVKCDKKQPCSNCARAKIECIFPGPGRAPRKSRKPADGELMDRLRRLEGVVQSLNAQVEEHEQQDAEREKNGTAVSGCPNGSAGVEQGGCPSGRDLEGASVVVDNSVEGLETRFGRLVVDQGRSRYINNSFWASLNNEVSARAPAILIRSALTRPRSKISRPSSSSIPTTQTSRMPNRPSRHSTRASSSDTAPPTSTCCLCTRRSRTPACSGTYTRRTWTRWSRCCTYPPSSRCFLKPFQIRTR